MTMEGFPGEKLSEEELAKKLRRLERLEEENRALKKEVEGYKTDSTTGVYSRHEHDRRISQSDELKRAVEEGETEAPRTRRALLMLDIDKFKDINDRYGHPAGDEVLRQAGEFLRSTFRKEDIITRAGGEEFAVKLPQTNPERLINKFYDPGKERPRLSFKAVVPYRGKSEEIEVTFSGGISSFESDAGLSDAIKRADTALYAAKEGSHGPGGKTTPGRDRILLYSNDMDRDSDEGPDVNHKEEEDLMQPTA